MEPNDRFERALETFQRNQHDQGRQIGALTDNQAQIKDGQMRLVDGLSGLASRVAVLEEARRAREIEDAREEEREKATSEWRKAMVDRMAQMEKNYDEGRRTVVRLLFGFITFFASAIGLGLIGFFFKRLAG